ncbi:MAG: 30S ribosomal protein S2, partial [Candidatus Aenigmatarchaeota archaeon]
MTNLVDRNEYLSAGVHIGMREKTAQMEPFIFKVRPDGLAVLDIEKTDERIEVAAKFLARKKNIAAVSRKSNGQKPVEAFAEAVGGRAFPGRFLPGTFTNPNFEEYFEPDVVVIADPAVDKQALKEAVKQRIPV